jgi:hypothetical protein
VRQLSSTPLARCRAVHKEIASGERRRQLAE